MAEFIPAPDALYYCSSCGQEMSERGYPECQICQAKAKGYRLRTDPKDWNPVEHPKDCGCEVRNG